jgi:hypothetical protein
MFTYEIRTEINIDASINNTWEAITDFPRYKNWNSLIPAAAGELKEGNKIDVIIHPPLRNPQQYKVKLLTVAPPKTLTWLGQFYCPFLFDGEHHFELSSISEKVTKVIHREIFRGLLVAYVGDNYFQQLSNKFEKMNSELKTYVESR